MQTVDVRILLPNDVDVEQFVERLGTDTRHHEVLGATQLVPDTWSTIDDGCGEELIPSRVVTRPGVNWDGSD